jgi:undecaprenyl-diphosphatase
VIGSLIAFARRFDEWIETALHWDRRASEAIAQHPGLEPWAQIFVTATYLGDGYLWAGLGLGLLLFGGPVDRLHVLIGFVITVANVTLFRLIKVLAGRLRPLEQKLRFRSRIVGSYSFPSGHATTSFGLAWVVARSYPYLAVEVSVYLVAAMIAFSRVYVQEHYPLDVLGGAILGSLVSILLYSPLAGLLF